MFRPMYDLAITIIEEKMPFIKYEPLVKSICTSIERTVFNLTGKEFSMPKRYR